MTYATYMSEADRIKEEIGWFKVVFAVLMATDITLIGWLAQNFGDVNRLQVIMAVVAVLAVTIVVVWINRMVYVRLETLEKL